MFKFILPSLAFIMISGLAIGGPSQDQVNAANKLFAAESKAYTNCVYRRDACLRGCKTHDCSSKCMSISSKCASDNHCGAN